MDPAARLPVHGTATLPRMTVDRPLRTPRWRRYGRRAVIALGVALACIAMLCCAGVAYIGYDAYRAPDEERHMEAFAGDLCRELLGSRPDAVYAMLSADARGRYSLEDFAHSLGRLDRCDVVRAAYLFLLTAYVVIEDDHGLHSIDLVREAGEWKIDSDLLHDLDSPPGHGGGGGFDD